MLTLLYACETWIIYQWHTRKLNRSHLNCLRKSLRITWQDKVPDTEVLARAELQAFKLCFREHNSDGLAMLIDCKIYTCQKDYFRENLHGAGNHMVARRNDTRTLSRSLSRTLDLTVQHGRHWHSTAQHGMPPSERVLCSLNKAELRQHKVNAGCANLGYPPQIFTQTICTQTVVEHSEFILI